MKYEHSHRFSKKLATPYFGVFWCHLHLNANIWRPCFHDPNILATP